MKKVWKIPVLAAVGLVGLSGCIIDHGTSAVWYHPATRSCYTYDHPGKPRLARSTTPCDTVYRQGDGAYVVRVCEDTNTATKYWRYPWQSCNP